MGNTPIGERGWLGNRFVPEEKAKPAHHEQSDIVVVETLEESVERYLHELLDRIDEDESFAAKLYEDVRGSTLGCWCQPLSAGEPLCHGEVIADTVDRAIKVA